MTELKPKAYLWCERKLRLRVEVCLNLIFTGRCKTRCIMRRKIMASKPSIVKYLKELRVKFDKHDRTIVLAQLLIDTVRRVGHVDDFSPELRRTLITDYQFSITDEEGNELDEFLNIKEGGISR